MRGEYSKPRRGDGRWWRSRLADCALRQCVTVATVPWETTLDIPLTARQKKNVSYIIGI